MDKPNNLLMQKEKTEVFTLGRFMLKRGGRLVSEETQRSKKLWELFKYLLANRGKAVHPEVVVETLWPEQKYKESKLVMRSLIFRLRKLLAAEFSSEIASNVTFSHGCYQWNLGENLWLDVAEFENISLKALKMRQSNPIESIATYKQAISLYKGDFLPECFYSEWVVPFRNYYQRLFLEDINNLTKLLAAENRDSEIIELCEKVFLIEYFAEEIHLIYMRALLKEGKLKKARAHYEEVSQDFYKEMGVKPSAELRDVYRIVNTEYDKVNLDLTSIKVRLKETKAKNTAFFCDPDVFRYLYQLEQFRRERSDKLVIIVLTTITLSDFLLPPSKVLKEAMDQLQNALGNSLRKGDVVCRWNEAQFLIMLPGLKFEEVERVLQRVDGNFKKIFSGSNLVLRKKYQSVLPTDSSQV